MTNIIYIKYVRGIDASQWFKGSGWYFIDETCNLQWGGDTREEALKTLQEYDNNL